MKRGAASERVSLRNRNSTEDGKETDTPARLCTWQPRHACDDTKKMPGTRPGKSNREASRLGDVGLVADEPSFRALHPKPRNSEMLQCSTNTAFIPCCSAAYQTKKTHPRYARIAYWVENGWELSSHSGWRGSAAIDAYEPARSSVLRAMKARKRATRCECRSSSG